MEDVTATDINMEWDKIRTEIEILVVEKSDIEILLINFNRNIY